MSTKLEPLNMHGPDDYGRTHHNCEQCHAIMSALSMDWEKKTGNDSIPTIERVYERTPRGAYVCVWPKCSFARHDSAELWRHVHTAHGEYSLPPDLWQR